MFDFWFEYKYVVPKGYSRIFSKLKEMSENGIKIKYFTGNHDMWVYDYLPAEIGAELYRKPETREIDGKKFYIAHGDGLGGYDKKYNLLKKVFANKFLQFMFKCIHPDLGYAIALSCSKSSRKKHYFPTNINYEEEFLVKYSRTVLEKEHFDYFVFGHRHIPYQYNLAGDSLFTNIGDWLFNFSYVVYDNGNLNLIKYPHES